LETNRRLCLPPHQPSVDLFIGTINNIGSRPTFLSVVYFFACDDFRAPSPVAAAAAATEKKNIAATTAPTYLSIAQLRRPMEVGQMLVDVCRGGARSKGNHEFTTAGGGGGVSCDVFMIRNCLSSRAAVINTLMMRT